MIRPSIPSSNNFLVAGVLALLLTTLGVRAQESGNAEPPPAPSTPIQSGLTLRPSIGVQTLWFNGDYPVRQDISPGNSRDLPLGGGVIGPSNGLRLQLELIPDVNGILRFPISAEAYFLSGKTTFAITRVNEVPTKRWTFTHTAQIFSAGAGVTALFFKLPTTLYFSAEGKVYYLPSTTLLSRIYNADTDETLEERELIPDPDNHLRYGAYVRVGTQVEFFEPLLLDFSVGYGGLNIWGKNTDPESQRNLMVVDPRNAPETTLGYIGLGFSVIWRL